jgi:hypothetical protein
MSVVGIGVVLSCFYVRTDLWEWLLLMIFGGWGTIRYVFSG